MSLVIDIHALQTLPPSLINRDDTGAPKSAVFGGVPRQRVSSQSWKRAIRSYFRDNFDQDSLGDRSKRLPGQIAKMVEEQTDWTQERAIGAVEQLFKVAGIKTSVDAAKIKKIEKDADLDEQTSAEALKEAKYPQTGYLLFLSPHQIGRAVEEIIKADGEKITKKTALDILDTKHSVDMALFGRMVADDAAYNVDASVQVAHALGIHASAPEFDFFTAVDDLAHAGEETGAGMLGTVQMMSSTLYRYATVNVKGLKENLESDEVTVKAVGDFIEAFVKSMPTGKINTFANQTLPDLVYVTVRDTRPVSLVNTFESVVEGSDAESRRKAGATALANEAREIQDTYGLEPKAAFVLGVGQTTDAFNDLAEKVTMSELVANVQSVLNK
jgi:CRISPR system Cascade subunit CasC